MKLVLDTTGGIAGGINRASQAVVAESLNDQDRRDAARMIKDLQNVSGSQNAESSRMRDSIVFTITCEDAGEKWVFQEHDFAMSDAFVNLMQWIMQHTSSSGRAE